MLIRADVERIIENTLSELKIEIERGNWTDPNTRVIQLKYKDKVISKTSFSVVQQQEYEG